MSLDALVVGTALPEHRVLARATTDAWENKIHACHCAATPLPMTTAKNSETNTRTRPAYGAT